MNTSTVQTKPRQRTTYAFAPGPRIWPSSHRHFSLRTFPSRLPSSSSPCKQPPSLYSLRRSSITRMQISTKRNDSNIATKAAVAAAAINATVSSEHISAPSISTKSFIARDKLPDAPLDPEGLPLSYDQKAIQAYWTQSRGTLQRRWAEFLSVSIPFFTRIASLAFSGGMENVSNNTSSLAKEARKGAEKLGPTYIKMGQMLSSRPDVLPTEALAELSKLQDAVQVFDTPTAISIIESELGLKLEDVFEEFSEIPVAAASLAQVYKATLKSNGKCVAVKVQRPDIRSTVSKDLYVLRRAAQIYQRLMERFAPQQRTNYIAILDEWAVGFYTELDFLNEMNNQIIIREELQKANVKDVYIPEVYKDLCRRRLLISEWVDGIKLSKCSTEDIRRLTAIGQEAFLTQLFQLGIAQADPHAGNLLRLNDGRLCILDFGLVATLQQEDIDRIVSAIIHLANRDYSSLIDDFINLEILPKDCDRATIMPLMDKALSPYVKGGGAKKYEAEIRKSYGMGDDNRSVSSTMGGFSTMTRDALSVLNDVPFSIPPYFALLGRAIITLEGIALQGDEEYALIMEAYPFVARKLLKDDTPELQKALLAALYGKGEDKLLSSGRLAALVNGAMGIVERQSGGVFVDLDKQPDNIRMKEILKFILSQKQAASLRNVLRREIDSAVDVLLRQSLRKVLRTASANVPTPKRIPFIGKFLPVPPTDSLPIPVFLPGSSNLPSIMTFGEFTDRIAPSLTREEELFAIGLTDAVTEVLGPNAAAVVSGDALVQFNALQVAVLDPLRKVVGDQIVGLGGSGVSGRRITMNRLLPSEFVEAFEELSVDDRKELDAEVGGILDRAWKRCVDRLDSLQ